MDSDSQTLKRMIASGRAGGAEATAHAIPALVIAIGKVARKLFDAEASFEDAKQSEMPLKSLLAGAPDPGLLMVVEAGDGQKGLISLDAMLVNGLVEIVTGAADNAVFRQARTPTMIDAALCQEFCTHLLSAFPQELERSAGQPILPGLTVAHSEIQAAKLAFSLSDTGYCCLSGKVAFQTGQRGGTLSLALPRAVWPGPSGEPNQSPDPEWSRALTANVMAAPLVLRADLETVPTGLETALGLNVGDLIPISQNALSDLTLISDRGVELMVGRLGQLNGKKAILLSVVNPEKSGVVPPFKAAEPVPALADAETKDVTFAYNMPETGELPLDEAEGHNPAAA